MVKNNVPIIKIREFFPPFIASREAARFITQKLINELTKTDKREAILDFRSINFISRSFADEILDSIEKLTRRGINLKTENVNQMVRKMLDLVKARRTRILKMHA